MLSIHTAPTDAEQRAQSPDYSMSLLRHSTSRQTPIQRVWRKQSMETDTDRVTH